MITAENISIIIQIATLVGIVYSVFLFFRKPIEKGERFDLIFTERFNNLEKTVINLRDNHIHTLEQKLDGHIEKQGLSEIKSAENFAKLFTMLDERLK